MNFNLVVPSSVTRDYKPNPKVYRTAINAFELEEQQTLAFVAAHAWDLAPAIGQWVSVFIRHLFCSELLIMVLDDFHRGFKTIYI